jgi:uncharacterized protein YoxC
MTVLSSMDNSLKMLISNEPETDKCNLNDLYNELSSVTSEVDSVVTAVKGVKSSISQLKESVERLDR